MFYPRILSSLLLLASPWSLISAVTAAANESASKPGDAAPISSKISLVHLGSIDSFTITEQGTLAGRYLLNALENKDSAEAGKAKSVYHAIIPKEHYGGEYTALEWFCDYLLGTDDERRTQLADRFHHSFFDFFADNDYANLKGISRESTNSKSLQTLQPKKAKIVSVFSKTLFCSTIPGAKNGKRQARLSNA